MGNENSRPEGDKGDVEPNILASVPQDSPLARMLKDWKDNPYTRSKDKKKMMKYCCSVWTRDSIGPPAVFWPCYGSEEDWLCQMLKSYVNNKQPFSQEESEYASCWKGAGNLGLFDHGRATMGARKEGPMARDSLPPTLDGPQGQEQEGASSPAVCFIDQATVGLPELGPGGQSHPGLRREVGQGIKPFDPLDSLPPPPPYQEVPSPVVTPLQAEPESGFSGQSHPGLRREAGKFKEPWDPRDALPPPPYQEQEGAPSPVVRFIDQATVRPSIPLQPDPESGFSGQSHPGLRREAGKVKEPWDPRDALPPPPYQEQEGAPSPPVRLIEQATVGPGLGREVEQCEKGIPNFPSPHKDRERSSAGQEDQFNEDRLPLGWSPISYQPVAFVNDPLTRSEVRSFKQDMKSFTEDPIGLAEQLDQFLGPSLYTWAELMLILSILFSEKEKGQILKAALKGWEKRYPPGVGVMPGKFPEVDPGWVPTNLLHRTYLVNLRHLIIQGIQEADPNNFIKALEISQGKEESPSAFLERLTDQVRRYAGTNLEAPLTQQLLKVYFVAKAWPDIRNKIQEMEGWHSETLADLQREAQKVYVERGEA
ncbi:PREDICTED: uncharacterized protein LOC106551690 [Thamnophis sirtalis]|uniref:Uncharacterized protein LOC106551690 n=1 Tax=Thamnophis sirtalis TaxID=35019 RepID=A0A6I9YM50_9SAUR|nr:PREDICTED: uncharacterized protein LOC106551690 [Thamnophis sirtalis]